MSNEYKILGVPKTATEVDIKRAYRKLAFEYHPDRNPNDASAAKKFREATKAYNALTNPSTSNMGSTDAENIHNDLERIMKEVHFSFSEIELIVLKINCETNRLNSKSYSFGMAICAIGAGVAGSYNIYEYESRQSNDWGNYSLVGLFVFLMAGYACFLGKRKSSEAMEQKKIEIEKKEKDLEILAKDLESKYGSAYRR